MLTLDELKDRLLSYYDTELLIEELQIEAHELLDRFEDKLIQKYEQLEEAVDE